MYSDQNPNWSHWNNHSLSPNPRDTDKPLISPNRAQPPISGPSFNRSPKGVPLTSASPSLNPTSDNNQLLHINLESIDTFNIPFSELSTSPFPDLTNHNSPNSLAIQQRNRNLHYQNDQGYMGHTDPAYSHQNPTYNDIRNPPPNSPSQYQRAKPTLSLDPFKHPLNNTDDYYDQHVASVLSAIETVTLDNDPSIRPLSAGHLDFTYDYPPNNNNLLNIHNDSPPFSKLKKPLKISTANYDPFNFGSKSPNIHDSLNVNNASYQVPPKSAREGSGPFINPKEMYENWEMRQGRSDGYPHSSLGISQTYDYNRAPPSSFYPEADGHYGPKSALYPNTTYDSFLEGPRSASIMHDKKHRFPNTHDSMRRGYGQPSNYPSPPRKPNSEYSAGSDGVRSGLLEEFRNNKNKKYELRDILGYVTEFSGDQHGSRFLQQKLETATSEEKQYIFDEIIDNSLQLMTDKHLANQMKGHILSLSLQMYGCRVVQKALEHILSDQQVQLIQELEGNILKCVKDQNGNHVIQKAIERISPSKIFFIIQAFYGQVYALATHPYGCRVIQRIFEHCTPDQISPLLDELHKYTATLVQDQYGNYVIQHILERGNASVKSDLISKIRPHLLTMSKHKFASNVVEKCVTYATPQERSLILDDIITVKDDGTSVLVIMMKDPFANYVIQKLLDMVHDREREVLLEKIRPHLLALKKFTYGKHLIAKVEKMMNVSAGTIPLGQPQLM